MGHVSRLAKARDRQQLGHDGRYVLDGDGRPLAIDPTTPAPVPVEIRQIGPESLVPMLLQRGITPAFQIRVDAEHKVVCLIALLGPVQVPLPFDVEQCRKVAGELSAAADLAEGARFAAGTDGTATDSRPIADETEGAIEPDHESLVLVA